MTPTCAYIQFLIWLCLTIRILGKESHFYEVQKTIGAIYEESCRPSILRASCLDTCIRCSLSKRPVSKGACQKCSVFKSTADDCWGIILPQAILFGGKEDHMKTPHYCGVLSRKIEARMSLTLSTSWISAVLISCFFFKSKGSYQVRLHVQQYHGSLSSSKWLAIHM